MLALGASTGHAQEAPAAFPEAAQADDVESVSEPTQIDLEADLVMAPQIKRSPFKPQLPAIIVPPVVVETETDDQTTTDGTSGAVGTSTGPDGEVVEAVPEILGMPKLTITGLVWNSDRPQAIVNGNIVEVGDRLFGIPTDKSETIPELTFSNITKEGLEVSYMDKSVILKPVDAELLMEE